MQRTLLLILKSSLMERIKLFFNGEWVEASWVDITQQTEQWNEYLLADGSVIRVKTVVTKIYRAEGKYDDEGNPLYITRSMGICATHSPDSLRKQE